MDEIIKFIQDLQGRQIDGLRRSLLHVVSCPGLDNPKKEEFQPVDSEDELFKVLDWNIEFTGETEKGNSKKITIPVRHKSDLEMTPSAGKLAKAGAIAGNDTLVRLFQRKRSLNYFEAQLGEEEDAQIDSRLRDAAWRESIVCQLRAAADSLHQPKTNA